MSILAPDTRVALLLTTRLTGDREKPLTSTAYSRLAKWLHDRGLRPSDLESDADLVRRTDFLEAGADPAWVRSLLDRGVKLALDMDRWGQRGIWVVGRGEERYPSKLRRTLKSLAPPVLFGAGDPSILAAEMIGVVGSRDAGEAALAFARDVAAAAVRAGYAVVSGAARGVDRAAMDEALSMGGRIVGVMAEGLEKVVSGREVRDLIRSGRGCFISTFEPDARWTVGRAMERNKIVYGLSTATFVAQTDTKGGTWEGAQENLKHGWVPIFVRNPDPKDAGGRSLAQNGATVVPGVDVLEDLGLQTLLDSAARPLQNPPSGLFGSTLEMGEPETNPGVAPADVSKEPLVMVENSNIEMQMTDTNLPSDRLYSAFLSIFIQTAQTAPLPAKEISRIFELPPSLVKKYMDRAVKEGAVAKAGKPARFAPAQKSLF